MFEEVLSGSVERSGVYRASEGRRGDAKVVGTIVGATRVFVVVVVGRGIYIHSLLYTFCISFFFEYKILLKVVQYYQQQQLSLRQASERASKLISSSSFSFSLTSGYSAFYDRTDPCDFIFTSDHTVDQNSNTYSNT